MTHADFFTVITKSSFLGLLGPIRGLIFEVFFKANFESVANVHSWNW